MLLWTLDTVLKVVRSFVNGGVVLEVVPHLKTWLCLGQKWIPRLLRLDWILKCLLLTQSWSRGVELVHRQSLPVACSLEKGLVACSCLDLVSLLVNGVENGAAA